MSSIGGIRRPGSAFARGSPTTSISCRSWSTITSRQRATRHCSMKSCRSSSRRSCATIRKRIQSAGVSEQTGTVYEHCVRALKHGFRLGSHGLPLMGTGDWNDGMNKVGAHGKGESVWNGWFFVTVLNAFAGFAERRSDKADDAGWCRERAERCSVLWRRMPGTALGIAVLISTMARLSDRRKMMSARSTPSLRPGR